MVTIRIAEIADAPAMKRIAALAYSKYLEYLTHPPIPLLHNYEDVAKAGNTHVFTLNRQVIGMVTFLSEPDHVLLRNLAVLPDYQGLGIGRKLVAFVESQARRRGLDEVRLWTREEMSDNIHYYQHLGYHLTHTSIVDDCGRAYFRKQLDHVENAPGNAVVEASR